MHHRSFQTGSRRSCFEPTSKRARLNTMDPDKSTLSNVPTFLTLPSEVLELVFSFLNVSDIVRSNLVCKLLRSIAQSDEVWRSLTKRDFPREFERPLTVSHQGPCPSWKTRYRQCASETLRDNLRVLLTKHFFSQNKLGKCVSLRAEGAKMLTHQQSLLRSAVAKVDAIKQYEKTEKDRRMREIDQKYWHPSAVREHFSITGKASTLERSPSPPLANSMNNSPSTAIRILSSSTTPDLASTASLSYKHDLEAKVSSLRNDIDIRINSLKAYDKKIAVVQTECESICADIKSTRARVQKVTGLEYDTSPALSQRSSSSPLIGFGFRLSTPSSSTAVV